MRHESVMEHCNVVQGRDPNEGGCSPYHLVFDCMVITVSKERILEQRGVVSDLNTSRRARSSSN